MSMSAFVVEDKTINRIVSWFSHLVLSDPYIQQLAKEEYKFDFVSEGWATKLAQSLHDMNIEAVNQRYSEHTELTPFTYTPIFYEDRIHALKSLMCWLYQCREGTVPNLPLFKFFEEVTRHVGLVIVMSLPEWEEAEWG